MTRKYLLKEITAFRELMGQKSFWAEPEKAARALGGLLYTYALTANPARRDAIAIEACCLEYDRRLAYRLLGD